MRALRDVGALLCYVAASFLYGAAALSAPAWCGMTMIAIALLLAGDRLATFDERVARARKAAGMEPPDPWPHPGEPDR